METISSLVTPLLRMRTLYRDGRPSRIMRMKGVGCGPSSEGGASSEAPEPKLATEKEESMEARLPLSVVEPMPVEASFRPKRRR